MNNSLKYLHSIYQPPHIPIPVHHRSHHHTHPHHHRPASSSPSTLNHLMNNINNNLKHHDMPPNVPAGNSNEAQQFLSKGGQVIVRMRGLPYDCTALQVIDFFTNGKSNSCEVMHGEDGVLFVRKTDGRATGDAFVLFETEEMASKALQKHRELIGSRYIELFRTSAAEVQQTFHHYLINTSNEAQQFLSKGGQVIVRMRGLPYDCTAQQVIDFFTNGKSNSCEVMHGEDGVLFVRKTDGRATGDAFVLFETEEMASKALQKHRELIGSRYIELFRISTAEVQQTLNRTMDIRTFPDQHTSLIANLPQVPLIPQQLMPFGSRKDCIRLRGLPFEAQVEQILEFLSDHSKNIVFQGVHMVYNAQGQPSGEAFIQMDSEQSAALASVQRHHKYMSCGKKQRYIEVFQCSIDDMNLVLTGGVPVQRPLLSPGHGDMLHTAFGSAYPPAYLQNGAGVAAAVTAAAAAAAARVPGSYYPPIIYWL